MDNSIDVPKLWGSARLKMAVFLFFAWFLTMWMRFNLAMGLVCMTGAGTDVSDPHYVKGEFSHWSREIQAHILGSFFYGLFLTQILGGYLADKFGPKRSLLGSMIITSLLEFLMPFSAKLHWTCLIGVRFSQGLAEGLIVTAIYTGVSTWSSSAERATLSAFVFSSFSISQIFNPPISAILCLHHWSLIFFAPGVIGLIWALAFYALAANSPKEHLNISREEKFYLVNYSCIKTSDTKKKRDLKVPWLRMLTSPAVHALWITRFAAVWIRFQTSLNLPMYINETFDLGIVYNGIYSGLPFVCMSLIFFSGKIYDSLNKRQFVSTNALRKIFNTVGLGIPAVSLCLIQFTESNLAKIGILTLATTANQLTTTGGYFLSHPDVAGPYAGTVFGLCNTLGMLSGIGNPLVIAALAPDKTEEEWQNVFYVASAIATTGAMVYLFLGENRLQKWATTTTHNMEQENIIDEEKENLI